MLRQPIRDALGIVEALGTGSIQLQHRSVVVHVAHQARQAVPLSIQQPVPCGVRI